MAAHTPSSILPPTIGRPRGSSPNEIARGTWCATDTWFDKTLCRLQRIVGEFLICLDVFNHLRSKVSNPTVDVFQDSRLASSHWCASFSISIPLILLGFFKTRYPYIHFRPRLAFNGSTFRIVANRIFCFSTAFIEPWFRFSEETRFSTESVSG